MTLDVYHGHKKQQQQQFAGLIRHALHCRKLATLQSLIVTLMLNYPRILSFRTQALGANFLVYWTERINLSAEAGGKLKPQHPTWKVNIPSTGPEQDYRIYPKYSDGLK